MGLLALAMLIGCVQALPAQDASGPTEAVAGAAPAGMIPTPERFAVPTLPADPTQADEGARTYALYCMACHGDRGQGLTEEFRAAWGHDEGNCWQSKCHASNYPPGGFELPLYVPPLLGERTLLGHRTALDLYDYVSRRMPYHMPGALSAEEYWALTAFLAREHGVDIGPQRLDPEMAAGLELHPEP